MGKTKSLIARNWKRIVVTILVIGICLATVLINMNSVPPGVSQSEALFVAKSHNLSSIIENPINLPMKLPVYLLGELGVDSIVGLRFIGSLFGLIFLFVFYRYIRNFQTTRVSVLTTILLATSSWYLHNSRLALPYILMPLFVMILLSLYYGKERSKSLFYAIFAGLTLGIASYVPAILPMIIAVYLYSFFTKRRQFKLLTISLFVFLITILPLIYALYTNPVLTKELVGASVLFEPVEWAKRLFIIPIYLVARGPYEPLINLSRLPLLDIFGSTLLVLGGYAIYYKLSDPNTKRLIIVAIISAVSFVFGGVFNLALFIPIIFIVLSYGIALLLQQWFTVFPKNPLVKTVGVTLVLVVLLFSSAYQLRRYFIAWPASPATKIQFHL